MSWQRFVRDVQENINPLVSQRHLRGLALQLHSMGEVSSLPPPAARRDEKSLPSARAQTREWRLSSALFAQIHILQSETVQDVVLLEPRWLCGVVLGRLLSAETPKAIHHYRGRYRLEELQALAPDGDAEELLQILDAMDVCARDPADPAMVDVPALIKAGGPRRSWDDAEGGEEDDAAAAAVVYGGVRLVPAEHLAAFPCGLFHKLQVNLCRWSRQPKPERHHRHEEESEADVHLWTDGAEVSGGRPKIVDWRGGGPE